MPDSKHSSASLSNGLYNKLKFVAQILLPALGTMWFAIGGLWSLPHTTEVVGTITAVDLFLGTVLKLSSRAYYRSGGNFDGDVNVVEGEDGSQVQFAFNDLPEVLVDDPGKHSIEFKINRLKQAG